MSESQLKGGYTKFSMSTAMRALRCGLYTIGGLFFLALGIVGIYLPGIPTTGPILLALFLVTRGNPHLRNRLRRFKMLNRYFEYLEGTRVMTKRTRIYAACCMWGSILASSLLLFCLLDAPLVPVWGCLAGGAIGSIVIYRFHPMRSQNQIPENSSTD